MREFLKGLELEKSQIDLIMTEFGKALNDDKEKNQKLLEEEKEKNSKLTEELNTTKEKVKEYENNTPDIEKIKKEQFDLGKEAGNKELETFKKQIALNSALKNTKAKDTKLLETLLNQDKISYEEVDGQYQISGLDEQIEELGKSHSYLFEASEQPEESRITSGDSHKEEIQDDNFARRVMGLSEK